MKKILILVLFLILSGCTFFQQQNTYIIVDDDHAPRGGITDTDQVVLYNTGAQLRAPDEHSYPIIEGDESCFALVGDTVREGTYILEYKDASIELGILSFVEGEWYTDYVGEFSIDGEQFFAVYQYVDCSSWAAYIYIYTEEDGLQQAGKYEQEGDAYLDMPLLVDRAIIQEDVIAGGLVLEAYEIGEVYRYMTYYAWDGTGFVPTIEITDDQQYMPLHEVDPDREIYGFYEEQPWTVQPLEVESLEELGDPSNETFETFLEMNITPLDAEYVVEEYAFAAASSWDYILRIMQGDEQIFMFTHVVNYLVMDDVLYLENFIYNPDIDQRQHARRIIDRKQQTKTSLTGGPGCTAIGGQLGWYPPYLMTIGYIEHDSQPELADICVYNAETGQQLYHASVAARWMGCAGWCLGDSIGLLIDESTEEPGLYILRTWFEEKEGRGPLVSVYTFHHPEVRHVRIASSYEGYLDEFLMQEIHTKMSAEEVMALFLRALDIK